MEVSDQIIKIMDEVGKRFGMAVDWTQNNVQPYLMELGHRIAMREIYTSTIWMVLGLIVLILGVLLIKRGYMEYKQFDCDTCIFGIVLVIIGMALIIYQSLDIVTALTIPEKIWMDTINEYVK